MDKAIKAELCLNIIKKMRIEIIKEFRLKYEERY